jgi:hypothetical protein
MVCMGRNFTVARPYLLIYWREQLSVSWESNPARVKGSGSGAKCYPRGENSVEILKIFKDDTNERNSIQWTSGYTGLPLWARSEWNNSRISKYKTGTDRRTVRVQTVLSLTQPFNTGYCVEYPVFAPILALCRAINFNNPIISVPSF